MTDTTPRQAVSALRSHPRLPSGDDERFTGYGVLGIPFASGHYLALRDMVASSVGPAYRAIWHRDPDGRWTIHTTGAPELTCPRYFGTATASVRVPSIEATWHGEHVLHVTLGHDVDWRIELASSPATRLMSAMAGAMPAAAWTSPTILAAMGPMARAVLQSGRMRLRGTTPNRQGFKAAPVQVWQVSGRASVRGADLGAPAPLEAQTGLGDFWLPQRGLFFVGNARFTPAHDQIGSTATASGATIRR